MADKAPNKSRIANRQATTSPHAPLHGSRAAGPSNGKKEPHRPGRERIDDGVEGFTTVGEFARIYAVSTRTVRGWIKHGHLPFVRIGRVLRIPRSAIKHLPRK